MKTIELEIYETAKGEYPKEFNVRVMVKTEAIDMFFSSMYYRNKKFLAVGVTHWLYPPEI